MIKINTGTNLIIEANRLITRSKVFFLDNGLNKKSAVYVRTSYYFGLRQICHVTWT